MHSCIYHGQVRHRRFTPVPHAFSYRLFQMYLDLDELPTLFTGRWLWSAEHFALAQFRRADHLGDPHIPLAEAVCDLVEHHTAQRPQGPIRLLTHLRYFGYCFNPVSFYFCYDRADQHVETIVAEVHNTPWGEQHCYVLHNTQAVPPAKPDTRQRTQRFCIQKAFHVSPFMDMDVEYDWRLSEPRQHLSIHIKNQRAGRTFFDASLLLTRTEISRPALAQVLLRYPFMTLQVMSTVYFQALRLKWKNVPFVPHPSEKYTPMESGQA